MGGGRDSRCCSPRTLISLTASALPWSFHSYSHTYRHLHTHTHLHIYLCPRSMHISMHKTSRHTLLLSLTSEQAFRQKWTEIPPGVTRRGGSPAAFCDKGGASEGDLIEWGTLQPWKLGGACSTRCEAAQVRMCIQTPPPTKK